MKPSSRWTPYVLVGPAVAFFTFVVGLPLLGTIGLSFASWSGTNRPKLVGSTTSSAHSGTMSTGAPISTPSSTSPPRWCWRWPSGSPSPGLVSVKGKRTGWYRITFFIPVMLPMVVIAVLWSFIYSDDGGLLNSFLGAIGQEDLQHVWLGDPSTALLAVSVVSGWVYAGFYMAIFYAGLQRVPHTCSRPGSSTGRPSGTCSSRSRSPSSAA